MPEQRYRAVLEVGSGVPVAEVAERYGVSRQSVHTWLLRYRQEGVAGLEDRSHRVHHHPWRIPAEIEELICELRRGHPEWGPRRLVFEMGRGRQVTRSSVYRALVGNGLVEPKSRRRRRQDYRRWERGTAMESWQLDVTASAFLASAAQVKIVTGSMIIPGSACSPGRSCGPPPGRCARRWWTRCASTGFPRRC